MLEVSTTFGGADHQHVAEFIELLEAEYDGSMARAHHHAAPTYMDRWRQDPRPSAGGASVHLGRASWAKFNWHMQR
jgi:hypothetical protein